MCMKIEDDINKKYISGGTLDVYKDFWIYNCFGDKTIFESPDNKHRQWVSKLYDKLKEQIVDFKPRNSEIVNRLFPNFEEISANYTIMLVVGFPSPYDAMVLEHKGQEFMVFDLIQFGKESLENAYSCHKVLTHELIHLCLHQYYPVPSNPSYLEGLHYKAFDEGFAHALSYPSDLKTFTFDDDLIDHYNKAKKAKNTLNKAMKETKLVEQSLYNRLSNTGDYWDKFAAISGKLYPNV